jgi:plastocyanin
MKMPTRLAALCACLALPAAFAAKIDLVDYCDPSDPGWAPTGGCLLDEGDVTLAEFNALLTSVHYASVVGHPAWTVEPTYTELEEAGARIKVRNMGGRTHTFTEVADYGGGVVPSLSPGLTMAPECAASVRVPPGNQFDLRISTPGLHKFQCCIHPWMRAAIRTP